LQGYAKLVKLLELRFNKLIINEAKEILPGKKPDGTRKEIPSPQI
jgi:hypothetical protein